MVHNILLGVTRFKSNLSEAITKNFVNLSNYLSGFEEWDVQVIAPLNFPFKGNKLVVLSEHQDYTSFKAILGNIYKLAKHANRHQQEYKVINLHLQIFLEVILFYVLMNKNARKKTVLTIWQPYLTLQEIRNHSSYYRKNAVKYLHHFLLNSFWLKPLYAFTSKKFAGIIVQSEFQAAQVRQMNAPVTIIPNGLKPPSLNDMPSAPHNGPLKLLYLGHLTPCKGVDQVVRLLAKMSEKCEVELTIAASDFGDHNPLHTLIEKLGVKDKIIHKGVVNPYKEMASHDALVVLYQSTVGTSHYHNVLIESRTVDVPVVTTKLGSIPEIIHEGKDGVFVTQELNGAEVDRVIAFLIKERERRIAEQPHPMLVTKFDYQKTGKQYSKFFNELAKT